MMTLDDVQKIVGDDADIEKMIEACAKILEGYEGYYNYDVNECAELLRVWLRKNQK